ncbi:MAG TPA: putative porin [Steroidobacteraceae bacterium]|nr:putative porin [Steroidobacteraceae bacterium]
MTKRRSRAPALPLALASAIALALASTTALADDYRVEARATYTRDELPNFNIVGDPQMFSLGGAWYFAPVSTDGVPLAEAAYLGHASYVGAVAARFEVYGTDLYSQAASIGYYIPGTMFFAGVGASRDEQAIAVSSTTVLTDYRTTWFGTVGITPLDGLMITTNLRERGYDPNITARHVGKLPNGHFYAGSVNLVDPDDGDTSFGVDFDYYFDDSTSLGVGYDDGGERFELRAEKFFSGSWAAGVSAYAADGANGLGLHVTWRH